MSDSLNPVVPCVVIDGRSMQPPEPLEKTLAALDMLVPGGEVVLQVYCSPGPLFNILRNNHYAWTEVVDDDGTHEIRIRHA